MSTCARFVRYASFARVRTAFPSSPLFVLSLVLGLHMLRFGTLISIRFFCSTASQGDKKLDAPSYWIVEAED
jgi:hypothetical protein